MRIGGEIGASWRRACGLTLLVAALAACGAPPPPEPLEVTGEPPDINLEEAMTRYEAALGGREAVLGIRTVRKTGTMNSSRLTGAPLLIAQKRPHFFRRQLLMPGVDRPLVEFIDGETAWKYDPRAEGPDPVAMPEAEADRYWRWADIEGPLVDYRAKGHHLELLSKEELDSGPAYHLKITYKDGGEGDVFLDAGSFLLVRSRMIYQAGPNMVDARTTFEDYRQAGGVMWPYKEITVVPVQGFRQVFQWETIEINPELEDTLFHQP